MHNIKNIIPDADYVQPLRLVGIMMRSQRAERATIICSAGSWDPTIVLTPPSTEGNYFRITTSVCCSSSKQFAHADSSSVWYTDSSSKPTAKYFQLRDVLHVVNLRWVGLQSRPTDL